MKLVAALTVCVCSVMGYGAVTRPSPRISVFERHVVEMARQRGVSVDEAVKAVRKWGIEGADLWFGDEEKPGNERMLAGGLKAATLIVFMDLAHTNDIARTETAIAYAKSVGSPRLMLVPGFVRKGEDRKAAWMRMKPNLADFVRRAGRAGLTVDIEDFDASDILIGSQEDLRRTFVAFPELGHVLDTGNYLFWTNDVLQAQREFTSRIRHVHVKDRAKDDMTRSVAAGTGIIPVKAILAGLQSANYNGWLTVECFGSTNMWDDVRRSAEYIAGILHDAEGDCPSGDVSKFDERIAADRSQVDVEGLEWVDGASLPLESRGFTNTLSPYARMPADLLPSCPEGVRAMSAQSTGHYFLFETDSNELAVEWVLREKSGRDPFIPPQGMYGIDIYDTVDGAWRFVRNGRRVDA